MTEGLNYITTQKTLNFLNLPRCSLLMNSNDARKSLSEHLIQSHTDFPEVEMRLLNLGQVSDEFYEVWKSCQEPSEWLKELLRYETVLRVKHCTITHRLRSIWQRKHVVTSPCRLHFLSMFPQFLSLSLPFLRPWSAFGK